MAEEGISLRAYARRRKCDESSVRRAIASGRLARSVVKDRLGAVRLLPALADREWAASTDPSKPRNTVNGRPDHRRGPSGMSEPEGLESSGPALAGARADPLVSQFAAARALREHYNARRARLEFEREEGRLLDADEVRAQAYQAVKSAREILVTMRNRIAAAGAGLAAADLGRLVDLEVDRAMSEFSRMADIAKADGPAKEKARGRR